MTMTPKLALFLVVVAVAPPWRPAGCGRGAAGKSHLVSRVLDGRSCDLGKTAVVWFKTWITPNGSAVLSHADFELSRSARVLNKIEFSLVRCSEAISFNTCEYFDTWKFPVAACGILGAQKMPWTTWLSNFTPKFRCPIQAGNYSFRNAAIDPNSVQQFGMPVENTIWLTKVLLFDDRSREYACVNFTFQFKRARN